MSLVDAATLAVALGCSPETVRRMVRQGRLTPVAVEHPRRGRPRMMFDVWAQPTERQAS